MIPGRENPWRGCVVVAAVACLSGLPTGGLCDEVTATRIAALSADEAAEWQTYWERSQAAASRDRDALATEVRAAGLSEAVRPPSGGDFKIPDDLSAEWCRSAAGESLIAAVLSYQTPAGGWSKHTGYGKGPRQPGMQWSSQSAPGKSPHYLGTIDNGATTKEIRFLAAAATATGRADCAAAVNRGLDYLCAAQFPSGGWPQVYPLEGGYHDNITLNDDAMTNVLELLQDVADGAPEFAGVDPERREQVARALDRGIACLLACQFMQDGHRTVWCSQHDPITLEPAPARAYEPAALSGVESSHVLRFLMQRPRPSPEVKACIEAGLAWLESAQVTGLAKVKQEGRTTYLPDDASDAVFWARFYDLETGAPIFPGKDGIVYPTYEAMAAANSKLGYDYLSTLPGSILRNGQKKWRKQLEKTGSL